MCASKARLRCSHYIMNEYWNVYLHEADAFWCSKLTRAKQKFYVCVICWQRVPKMLTRINDQHIMHLCTGGEFNMALDADFSLWVWGKNDQGQVSWPGWWGVLSQWMFRNNIIIKRISRVPIYHTRWQHRALYNNTNQTHTHEHMHARTHSVRWGDGQGCEKQFRNSY